jgi:N-acetylated-alpha-linked acidic dipeptidase
MSLGFGGEGVGGQYHSAYDSYDYYTRFGDPGYAYGKTLSETTGRIMMRMGNADVLPFDFSSFTRTVLDYVTELKTLLNNTRSETEVENKMISEKLFDIAKDPKKQYRSPASKSEVPFLNFSDLENSLTKLKKYAEAFQKSYSAAMLLPVEKQKELNEILYKAERSLTQEKGLPRRSWYKHQIYAPGYYTGYGVKTLPGIREGIEQRNWKEAQENIEIVSKTITEYSSQVQKAQEIAAPKKAF